MNLKLGMQHRILDYDQVCSNDAAGLTLTYFTAKSNLAPYAFVWEKVKTMEFSEIIVVYDTKVGRCSQLNRYMKLYEYQWSRSFTDLGQNHFNIFNLQRYRTNGPLVLSRSYRGDSESSQTNLRAHSWIFSILFTLNRLQKRQAFGQSLKFDIIND